MSLKNFCVALLTLFITGLTIAQETGIAGYYADEFHNRKTASGELYDKTELTGAHKTLPFGTYVKVTRLDNNKSVVVRINDRGPYLKGRVIDISRAAAVVIGLVRDGLAKVKVEPVAKPSGVANSIKPVAVNTEEAPRESALNTPPVEPTEKPAEILPAIEKPKKENLAQPVNATKTKPVAATMLTTKNYSEYDLYKIQLMRPEKSGFGVQVASMTQYENVLKQVAKLQERYFKNILISVEPGPDNTPVYKVILGPFPDMPTAASYKESLRKKHKINGFTVNLSDIVYE